MELMSIAEIINEIDSYLSLLRTARDLLSAPLEESWLERPPRRQEGVDHGRKRSLPHEKTPLRKLKSRSTDHESGRKATRPRFKSVVRLPVVVPAKGRVEEKVPVSAAAHIPAQDADESVLLTSGSIAPIQGGRRPKKMIRKELSATKPAIALAGGLKGRVVVVPAEQVRRQREEAARPKVLRPRLPAYGGRLAFEALFKDEADSPTPSLK